ncbi:MAG: family 16 glycoside hydrolase [Candidatus Methylomirabilis sp.]
MPTWEVHADPTAPSKPNVLAQRSKENAGEHFNLAIVEDSNYQDLELEVSFKAVEGEEDRGGGVVWRYQDPNNYYIARANPLEDNFRIYRVVKGWRKQLQSASAKVTSGTWHTIRIVARGDRMEGFYDGERRLEIRDETFARGKIGLWTKADAVTHFDDLRARPLK